MKNTRLKLFPPMLMLVAGSITSIMTYHFQYELKAALLILLSVLLVFYILGLIFVRVVETFDRKNALEQAKREAEEAAAEQDGTIVEISGSQGEEISENAEE